MAISDHDNVLEAGELRVSLTDAMKLINASLKDQQDGRYMLARDVIATELNLRAGNPGTDGNASTVDPQTLLDQAVKWLTQTTQNGDQTLTVAELSTWKVATSSSAWNALSFDADPSAGGIRAVTMAYSAAVLHTQLDGYNNNGKIFGTTFANDGDIVI